MRNSHRVIFAILIVLAFNSQFSYAQKSEDEGLPDREHAIVLYQQGDFTGASVALRAFLKRNKNDVTAWHYLGLAFGRLGKIDDARKAHEKAAKIGDADLTVSLDRLALPAKPELVDAADSAEQYLTLSPKLSKKKSQEWQDRVDVLRFFANQTATGLEIYSGKEVTTKVRVISKPEPTYTEDARKNQITGTVVLRAVFAADGTVRAIHVTSGLPDGLDRRAVEAARHIRFIPATKDGRPVSMWMELQYNFNLY